MIDINSILCPIDFSEFSRHGLMHAVQLARWFNSRLTVLYVYPPPGAPPPVLFSGLPGPLPPYPALTVSPDSTHEAMVADVANFVRGIDTEGIALHVDACAGAPVGGILREASKQGSDLIVIGTHGHSGFDRWILGSVTEKILRKASCPVLTVPAPVAQPPGEPLGLFKRMLCAVDFSDASLKALEYSFALAKEADAELLILHVLDALPDAPHWRQPNDPVMVEYLRLMEQDAIRRLDAAVPQDARDWCRPEQILGTGKPYAEILRVAEERAVNLIVLGVHGRNPIDLMFLGSTTNQVVRASTCPVLTVRG
jgi:nucleotide-binding universal stress UspA family protein